MSICWKCGQDEGTNHFNGKGCPDGMVSIVGGSYQTASPTNTIEAANPSIVISYGLEKIEPLTGKFFILKQGEEIINKEGIVASKLNEVIEKVNRMMDYLNQGVKP